MMTFRNHRSRDLAVPMSTNWLQEGSQRRHDGKHDFLPWLNHFLAIVRRAYGEFEQRAGQVKAPRGAETVLVQAAIEAQSGPFRVSDIQHACPSVSLDLIRQVLKNLRGSKVECLGRGQNAQWQKLANG
jgi:hypothetical protein